MPDVRYNKSHHAGPDAEARINNRLKSSGSPEADSVTKTGTGAQRVFHQIHNAGTAKAHNTPLVGSNRPFKGDGDQ
jgi:hypothetical protein